MKKTAPQPTGRIANNRKQKSEIEINDSTLTIPAISHSSFERNREILEQMQLCQQLIANNVKIFRSNSNVKNLGAVALLEWYKLLAAACLEIGSVALRPFVDIPGEPDPEKRATAFFPIINAVVHDLDKIPKDNIKRFIMHVAWHEGAKLTTRTQIGGPAKSFFQFEAYRAKEALAFAQTKGLLKKLAIASGNSDAELLGAAQNLPDYDKTDSSCSIFPSGNLIGVLLENNDQFGTYLARIDFMQFSATVGNTNAQHADYWYQYWKRTGGNPVTLKATFTKEANECDGMIASLVKQFKFQINKEDWFLTRSGTVWLQKHGSSVSNTYFDRGHDATFVYMDDGAKGVVELRVPVGGGVGQERLYRRGGWNTYANDMVAEYG